MIMIEYIEWWIAQDVAESADPPRSPVQQNSKTLEDSTRDAQYGRSTFLNACEKAKVLQTEVTYLKWS